MELKLSEVLNMNQTLKCIIDDNKKKIDPLFKFKLLGIMKSIEPHVENFEIIRNEKIVEYGEESEDGKFSIPKDNIEIIKKFSDSLENVLKSNVKVDIQKLKIKEVFDAGVSAEYLVGLYGIMEE